MKDTVSTKIREARVACPHCGHRFIVRDVSISAGHLNKEWDIWRDQFTKRIEAAYERIARKFKL